MLLSFAKQVSAPAVSEITQKGAFIWYIVNLEFWQIFVNFENAK